MAWMNTLYLTYENNVQMAGKADQGQAPLSLIAHMVANAQIEITLNENGNFLHAAPVDKNESKTLIPVTEQSAGRSSGSVAHALCDTLSYIAEDFSDFSPDEKSAQKSREKFQKYISALEAWVHSEYSHPKAKAVYEYARQGKITSDLLHAGQLECSENGKLADKKMNGIPYEKLLVRFRVLSAYDRDAPSGVWEDATLFDSYTKYYLSIQAGRKDICYLTGTKETISVNHPKGILSANYGAKLISANDSAGFTFRGRFTNSDEACAVSYEATQKAHSALTWLAAHQGIAVGKQDKRTFICWNPKGKEVPNLDSVLVLEDDENEPASNTEAQYKKRLSDTFKGYRNQLDNNDDIVVIGLDAATTGRLSVTYYNELKASDFFNRLKKWGETCCWYFTEFTQDNKPYLKLKTPLTRRIVEYAFGTEQGNFVEVNDKVMKEQSQRILHCMIDEQPLPFDIVHALAIKASTPVAYSRGNHERILSVACALIAKYHKDKSKGVELKMTLDYENRDRSYLFGRLLAVAERVERSTFSREDKREPNAIRLQAAFMQHPMQTWYTLEKALLPYYAKLNPGSRIFYKDILSGIIKTLKGTDAGQLNKSLEDTYLIGYYLQRAEFTSRKDTENIEEDENA